MGWREQPGTVGHHLHKDERGLKEVVRREVGRAWGGGGMPEGHVRAVSHRHTCAHARRGARKLSTRERECITLARGGREKGISQAVQGTALTLTTIRF